MDRKSRDEFYRRYGGPQKSHSHSSSGFFEKFGRFAARMDDIANWIPARLTSLLMAIAGGRFGVLKFVRKYARCHASPNSGYPESALAGILDVQFGGPHTYFGEVIDKPFIGDNPRALTTEDAVKAIKVNRISEVMMIVLTVVIGTMARYFIFCT